MTREKMETQHTTGPWHVENNTMVRGPNGQGIAGCHYTKFITVPSGLPSHDTAEANARLIAAAPELLAALKRALPVLEMRALEGPAGNSVAAQIRDEARAALSAAKERK